MIRIRLTAASPVRVSCRHASSWHAGTVAAVLWGVLILLGLAAADLPHPDAFSVHAVSYTGHVSAHVHDGDPPDEVRHRAHHLKKPRLSALQVFTLASPVTTPAVFASRDSDAPGSCDLHSQRRASHDAVPPGRACPSLRLHPGQAPPHTA
ncbi:hypothetical protein IB223_04220 [Pseudoxanthomonas sp. PXM03]|uniref:hypothetical protein n=1 Tax=Pseudoxanthomonas sp. PXM03 TaxID=2769284 RepID=UPI00177ECB79|nr:hypothetical protein [Pseudoxanthomonas sp. PXM03]MBD9435293.1 hypothetical protein [Pseudoxanthomonas sp. PXM03]